MNALLSNPFKERLRKGEVQIGLWLSSTTAYMAEIAATSGYDWLLIDGEHAPNTIQDLYHQLQAVAPYASQPVIRPVEGDAAGLLTLAAVAVIGSLIIFTLRVNRTVAQTDVAHH